MNKHEAYGDIVITLKGGPIEANDALHRIYKRDGSLTPKKVVKEAKRLEKRLGEQSPLHPYFTWDVQEAAEKQWHREASELIRVFYIQIEEREVRAWTSVEDGESRTYKPTTEVMTSDDLYAMRLERFKREVEHLVERAKVFEEAAEIVRAAKRFLAG